MISPAMRIFRVLLLAFGFFLFMLSYVFVTHPNVEKLKGCITTAMYDVELCPKKSNYVPIGQISPYLRNAVVVSEDASFYDHNGFDFFELRQSFETNIKSGHFARGGSTITQQLAKNVYLTPRKSIVRKIREALITIDLEKKFKKNEILEKYLNVVEMGPKVFGVKKASNYYFKKSAKDLNSLESAFLAFLLPNPLKYSQSFKKGELSPFARQGVLRILARLVKFRRLSSEEYHWASENVDKFPWKGLGAFTGELPSVEPIPRMAPETQGEEPPYDEPLVPEDGPEDLWPDSGQLQAPPPDDEAPVDPNEEAPPSDDEELGPPPSTEPETI